MVLPICWMITGASPSVGSSRSSSRAPVRRMRPMASICCSPPESLVPWLLSRSLMLGKSSKMRSVESPPGLSSGGRKRFSCTSRLAKIPRSSGQKAIPSLAIRSEVSVISSLPSKRTEPVRCVTMPMIDFSVVVLPAPLRPRSVTTSPARTSRSTPCRMCDSPYHACKFSTARSGGGARSSMADPHIGFAHVGVVGNGLIVALGEHPPAREHGDLVREVRDHAEIVLDHQHRAVGGDAPDQLGDAVDVLVAHAGGGLVEQEHFRIERKRGGDLERAFAAIGQFDRGPVAEGGEPHIVDQLFRTRIEAVQHAGRMPEVEGVAAFLLQRDTHVFEDGEMRKYRRDLERVQ